MKKIKIAQSVILATSMAMFSSASYAALAGGETLHFTDVNSYWGFDTDNDLSVDVTERIAISSVDGLQLGTTQPLGGIDNQWLFFSNIGFHITLSAPTVAFDDTFGNARVDMAGWTMNWNGVLISLGAGAWAGNLEGLADVTCGNTCESGDEYSLFYSATVPSGDPSGFGDVRYCLELHSSSTNYNSSSLSCDNSATSTVPVPAAAWLFGSGLIGIVGLARRKEGFLS